MIEFRNRAAPISTNVRTNKYACIHNCIYSYY